MPENVTGSLRSEPLATDTERQIGELRLAVASLNDQCKALRELVHELRGDLCAHITNEAKRDDEMTAHIIRCAKHEEAKGDA